MSELYDKTYNPDVLSCLANLSNDEVFTPPEVANQMLDMLPKEIWSDPDATFLDPACKSNPVEPSTCAFMKFATAVLQPWKAGPRKPAVPIA